MKPITAPRIPPSAATVAPVRAPTATLVGLVRLVRPRQWAKNVLVFAALLFSQRLFDIEAIAQSLIAFVALCAISGASYVLNDLRDLENDRLHPEKRFRPLAAGIVGRGEALAVATALAAAAVLCSLLVGPALLLVVAAYAALQIGYSLRLKEIVVVDVMALASGFVLRAVAGGVAIDVTVSSWLIICTFLLALFLALAKRRHELTSLHGEAAAHRVTLREYSPYFLDQMIGVVTASTVVAYAIYTASPEVRFKLGTDHLHWTLPFVLFGVFRYLYLVHRKREGGDPTRLLLSDRPLIANGLLWLATVVWLLYVEAGGPISSEAREQRADVAEIDDQQHAALPALDAEVGPGEG